MYDLILIKYSYSISYHYKLLYEQRFYNLVNVVIYMGGYLWSNR